MKRSGDQLREEGLAGEVGGIGLGELGQHSAGPEQRADRVVAEERGEEAADRRQAGDLVGHPARHSVGAQPGTEGLRQVPGQTDDHQREEDADR